MARLVLLVDDDPIVRSFIQDALRREGLQVLPACSGEEALEFLDQLASIDALVTDVYMGKGMSGLELAERVLEKRPGTPVLVISAYCDGPPAAFGKILPFLAKPFSTDSLVQRVREVLAIRAETPLAAFNLPNLTTVTPQ